MSQHANASPLTCVTQGARKTPQWVPGPGPVRRTCGQHERRRPAHVRAALRHMVQCEQFGTLYTIKP